jgi:hypothetical protein
MKNNEENRQAEILKLLNEGVSYSTIQENLGVSSKTISKVKKDNFPLESSDGKLSRPSEQALRGENHLYFHSDEGIGKQNQYKNSDKNDIMESNPMNNHLSESRSEAEIDLEMYKARLQYDLEMAKMQHQRQIEERNDSLKKAELQVENQRLELEREKNASAIKRVELQIEHDKFELEQNRKAEVRQAELKFEHERFIYEKQKTAELRSILTKQFQLLIRQCEEGDWTFDEISTYIANLSELHEKMNQGFHSEDEGFYFWEHIKLLEKISSYFKLLLVDWEDDVYEIEFDDELTNVLQLWKI